MVDDVAARLAGFERVHCIGREIRGGGVRLAREDAAQLVLGGLGLAGLVERDGEQEAQRRRVVVDEPVDRGGDVRAGRLALEQDLRERLDGAEEAGVGGQRLAQDDLGLVEAAAAAVDVAEQALGDERA